MNSFDRRRDFLKTAGLAAGGAALVLPALASPEDMRAALTKITGGADVRRGRVKLQLPPLVENGNSVEFSVTVDSPMTETDYVKAIHVFTEKNPQPYVINAYLGPRAGRARITSRTRLADTQTVHAVAELSNGTFWTDSVSVVVTLSACIGDLI